MNEIEAVELLGKLKDYMENTNKQIEFLIRKTGNLQIDIDNIKKHITNKNKINGITKKIATVPHLIFIFTKSF